MRLFGSNIGVIIGTSASLASGSISLNEPLPGLQFIYSDPLFTSSLTSGSIANIQTVITTASDIGASGELFIEISDPNNLKSSGSEVIRFTVSESIPRVGIGTSTPSSLFEIKSTSATSKGTPDIVLSSPSGALSIGDETGRLTFALADQALSGSELTISGSTGAIYSKVLGQSGLFQYGSLVFEIDGASISQRDWPVLEMGYGIIGGFPTDIGTVLSSSLEIGGITQPQFRIKSTGGSKIAELGYDAVVPPEGDYNAGALALFNDGIEQIRFTTTKSPGGDPNDRTSYISSSGDFGVGTKTPSEKLEVVGNIAITSGSVSSSLQTINTTLASDSATNVDTFATASYTGAIYDYILVDATVGTRAGQFMVAQDDGNITFTDTSTKHLTDPVIPEISAQINEADVEVQVTNGNGYTFKSFVKKL